jgi:hypothetical protein
VARRFAGLVAATLAAAGCADGLTAPTRAPAPATAQERVAAGLSGPNAVRFAPRDCPPSDGRIRIIEASCHPGPQPLFVVDGARVATGRELRPEDIVSIEVIKPEQAVARYGRDAAHGAVIIRTRGGAVPSPTSAP